MLNTKDALWSLFQYTKTINFLTYGTTSPIPATSNTNLRSHPVFDTFSHLTIGISGPP